MLYVNEQRKDNNLQLQSQNFLSNGLVNKNVINDKIMKLNKLYEMKEKGVLSEQDYNAIKERLIKE